MENKDWAENIVKKQSIEILEKLGYQYISISECEEIRERNYTNVILKPILRRKIKEINKIHHNNKTFEFSNSNIEQSIKNLDVLFPEGKTTVEEKNYEKLMLGEACKEVFDGKQEFRTLDYIDWKNWKRNSFHVTEEFKVKGKNGNIFADLVLFVNGIPLVVIECKAQDIPSYSAVNQLIRNNSSDYVPQLFKYATFSIATNGHDILYGTSNTSGKFFTSWKYEKDEKEEIEKLVESFNLGRTISNQDCIFTAMLNPERLLEITQYFTIFDVDKKVCRYHQYYTVKKVIKHINDYDHIDQKRKGGTIWHTQGSGKSLTMVMIAKIVLSTISLSKVIIVTDRKELDNQIRKTFACTKLGVNQATSGTNLLKILKEDKGDVITTIINKFGLSEKENYENNSKNIIVLVDENHRTQYGEMAERMRSVFPNACYLGFTGTPLLIKEKTKMLFGDYIRNYTIDDAIDDNVVVKINYDSRFIRQEVDEDNMNLWFENKFENFSDEQKNQLIEKWKNISKVYSSQSRLRAISMDVFMHYKTNIWPSGHKGILVAGSQLEAVRYYNIFKQEFEEINKDEPFNVELLISAPNMQEDTSDLDDINNEVTTFWKKMMKQYNNDSNAYEEKIKDGFLKRNVHIVIVVRKLLTGFDAPSCQVIYIDRVIKEHELLQAIARVNRIKEDKKYGLVVDYRGLLPNIDKALKIWSGDGCLNNFDEKDIANVVFGSKIAIEQLIESFQELESNFSIIIKKNDINEYIKLLKDDDELLKKFYKDFRIFYEQIKIVLSINDIYTIGKITKNDLDYYKSKLLVYKRLEKTMRLMKPALKDIKKYDNEMQSLIDNYINSKDAIKFLPTEIDIMDKEAVNEALERVFTHAEDKIDALLNNLNYQLKILQLDNPDPYYLNLAKEIKETLEKNEQRVMAQKAFLEEKAKIIEAGLNALRRGPINKDIPKNLKHDKQVYVAYRLIKNFLFEHQKDSNKKLNDEQIGEITLKVKKIINEWIKPDWFNNKSVKNDLSSKLFYYLSETTDKFGILEDKDKDVENLVSRIIESAKNWT